MWRANIFFLPKHKQQFLSIDKDRHIAGVGTAWQPLGFYTTTLLRAKLDVYENDELDKLMELWGRPQIYIFDIKNPNNRGLSLDIKVDIICFREFIKDIIDEYLYKNQYLWEIEDYITDIKIGLTSVFNPYDLRNSKGKRLEKIRMDKLKDLNESYKKENINWNDFNKSVKEYENFSKKYVENVRVYKTENVFNVVLLEIIECIENKIKPIVCSICGCYYFSAKYNKASKICPFCKPPSHKLENIKDDTMREYAKLRKRLNSYISRGIVSYEEANKQLLEFQKKNPSIESIKLIKPRERKVKNGKEKE